MLNLEAHQIASKVKAGSLKASEVVASALKRASELNPKLNALLSTADTESQLDELENRLGDSKQAPTLPLAGVPIVIKDNIAVKGEPLTCASQILGDYRSPYDAVVIEKLKRSGAIIVAKANLDEFAMGSSNETSAFGAVKNPWDRERVPGGSSGGSAAAVAARFAPLALGSDTGGSIRQPAAFCGVVGYKPSYGRVSRYGLVSYGSSLDQIGPMGHSVRDVSLCYDVICGDNAGDLRRDSTANPLPYSPGAGGSKSSDQNLGFLGLFDQFDDNTAARDVFYADSDKSPRPKIGIIKELYTSGLDPDVKRSMDEAIESLRSMGYELKEVSIPSLKYAIACYYVIATSEASSNLSRFDGIRYGHRTVNHDDNLDELYLRSRSEGFGPEVQSRIMLGAFSLSSGYVDEYYSRAQKVRRKILMEFAGIMKDCPLLLSPSTPTPAFKIGEKIDDPIAMYLNDICTTAANLTGMAAISLPVGLSKAGLPLGLQLMAFNEADLLKTAALLEENVQFQSMIPSGSPSAKSSGEDFLNA